jgi:DNA-binding transcriptional LysR family regulator
MSLNLRELEVFRAVMEAGGVGAAAAALGITQPAASKMLRQAEERLGFPLFRRDGRRLAATPEAHALLPELIGAFAAIGGVRRLAEALRAGHGGQVSIAAVPVLATALLPAAIRDLRAASPGVSVRLRGTTALEAVNQVASHQADLGVILGTTADPRIEARSLCASQIGCLLPRDHPLAAKRSLALSDLAGVPVISLGPQQPVGQIVQQAGAAGRLDAGLAIEVSQSSIACALVRAGAGVAILDGFGLQEGEAQGLAARPLRPRIPLEVTLVAARDRVPSRQMLALRAALEARFSRAYPPRSGRPPSPRPTAPSR